MNGRRPRGDGEQRRAEAQEAATTAFLRSCCASERVERKVLDDLAGVPGAGEGDFGVCWFVFFFLFLLFVSFPPRRRPRRRRTKHRRFRGDIVEPQPVVVRGAREERAAGGPAEGLDEVVFVFFSCFLLLERSRLREKKNEKERKKTIDDGNIVKKKKTTNLSPLNSSWKHARCVGSTSNASSHHPGGAERDSRDSSNDATIFLKAKFQRDSFFSFFLSRTIVIFFFFFFVRFRSKSFWKKTNDFVSSDEVAKRRGATSQSDLAMNS